MHTIVTILRRFHSDQRGATSTEYLLLLVLIACFVIAIVKLYGETIKHKFANANNVVKRRVTL